MKKLIAIFAVLLIAGPALAADWSFYGSARMNTFWDHRDYDEVVPAGLGTEDDDDDLLWDFASNSRLGARVKADKVSGRIELALPSTNTHDGNVQTRLMYGTWKFADNMSLKVGKDYTPTSQFISAQTFYEDLGLLGIGTTYGRRPGQIALQIGGFELALIQPNSQTFVGGDSDEWLPKIEAKFGMPLGMFSFNVMGGFQTYTVEDVGFAQVTDDIDIVSYILGADIGVNIGAFYIKAAGSWGQNWTNARWNDLAFTSNANAGAVIVDTDEWLPKIEAKFGMPLGMFSFNVMGGFQTFEVEDAGGAVTDDIDVTSWIVGGDVGVNIGAFYIKAAGSFGENWSNARWNDLAFTSNANAGAILNGAGDDTDDCTSWMAALVLGLKFSSDLAFEVGAGYRNDDQDAADNEDEVWSAYANATITLAPGVYLVPEVGYVDYMDAPNDNVAGDKDQGYEWYAGMKWQIDF